MQAFSGLPLTWLLVVGLPQQNVEAHQALYSLMIIVFGLIISWCSAACNSPLFAEVVPAEQRSLIYAFDRCFEGAPCAPLLASRPFLRQWCLLNSGLACTPWTAAPRARSKVSRSYGLGSL